MKNQYLAMKSKMKEMTLLKRLLTAVGQLLSSYLKRMVVSEFVAATRLQHRKQLRKSNLFKNKYTNTGLHNQITLDTESQKLVVINTQRSCASIRDFPLVLLLHNFKRPWTKTYRI